MKPKIQTYTAFDADLVQTRGQAQPLPANYDWAQRQRPVLYRLLRQLGKAYWQAKLHARFVNLDLLRPVDGSFFLYGNHTQAFGDPFLPAVLSPRPVATLAAAANLTVPVLGPLLPHAGALVLPETASQTRHFMTQLKKVVGAGTPVAIYPEAHVWPYYTGIRPFKPGSFHYPVQFDRPVFCFTTTYQRHHVTIYLDGPFTADESLPLRARREQLAAQVQAAMQRRAQASIYQRIQYRRQTR